MPKQVLLLPNCTRENARLRCLYHAGAHGTCGSWCAMRLWAQGKGEGARETFFPAPASWSTWCMLMQLVPKRTGPYSPAQGQDPSPKEDTNLQGQDHDPRRCHDEIAYNIFKMLEIFQNIALCNFHAGAQRRCGVWPVCAIWDIIHCCHRSFWCCGIPCCATLCACRAVTGNLRKTSPCSWPEAFALRRTRICVGHQPDSCWRCSEQFPTRPGRLLLLLSSSFGPHLDLSRHAQCRVEKWDMMT